MEGRFEVPKLFFCVWNPSPPDHHHLFATKQWLDRIPFWLKQTHFRGAYTNKPVPIQHTYRPTWSSPCPMEP